MAQQPPETPQPGTPHPTNPGQPTHPGAPTEAPPEAPPAAPDIDVPSPTIPGGEPPTTPISPVG